MGTRLNRLSEAALTSTCTPDLCLEQKKEKYHNFSFENYYFYSCEKSLYIAWARFRNAPVQLFLTTWFMFCLFGVKSVKGTAKSSPTRVCKQRHVNSDLMH